MSDTVDVDFFEEALRAEGLTNATVTHYRDAVVDTEVLRVEKRVDGEKIVHEQHITDREILMSDNLQSYVATLARQVARLFDAKLTETLAWGDKSVKLDLNEDLSATCGCCGAEASMDDLTGRSLSMSEMAVPQPAKPCFENLPPVKIRMTLFALLKEECKPQCPNSPKDPMHRNL